MKEDAVLTGEILVYKVDLAGPENGACIGA